VSTGPQQQQAIGEIFAGLNHGQPATSSSVVSLILDPLLQGMASQR
jgi:hypothetical protein